MKNDESSVTKSKSENLMIFFGFRGANWPYYSCSKLSLSDRSDRAASASRLSGQPVDVLSPLPSYPGRPPYSSSSHPSQWGSRLGSYTAPSEAYHRHPRCPCPPWTSRCAMNYTTALARNQASVSKGSARGNS